MKKIAIALSSFFLLFSVLFGCVPTPEQEIVHKKDESQMIEEAQKPPITSESTVSEQVQAPEKWGKSTDEEQFHIRSNAPIIVPNCSAFPIYEVEAVPFTQVQVDILWNRLIGDQEMRDNQTDDSMLPKSQLAMMMQSEQERIEQFEHDEYYEENVQNAQERIKYYKSLYPTAPDDWIYTPATSEIREIVRRSSEDVCYIQGIDATNENGMTFQLFNDIFYEKNERNPIPFVQFLFRRERSTSQWIIWDYAVPIDSHAASSGQDGLALSPQEAITIGNELIQAVDASMEIDRVELYNARPYNDSGARYDHWCYAIMYHRTVDDCPIASINGVSGGRYAATPTWVYEQCAVLVDDDGIQFVEWKSPLVVGECRVKSSKLLTFKEVEPLAETMLRYKYIGQAEGSNLTMNVTEVRLELMRTVQQDNVTKGILVPVWNFYGIRQRDFSSDQFDDDKTMNMLLLSLNAITGNPIDASSGY